MATSIPQTPNVSEVTRPLLEQVVLDILVSVSNSPQVRENLDIPLFDKHLIDSFDVMQIIVEILDRLGIEISPAEIERDAWATPRKIVDFVWGRAGAH